MVRSILVGIGGAVVGALLWTLVAFVVPLFVPMLVGRVFNQGGVGAASIGTGSILFAALVGFVTAMGWRLRLRP